MQNVRNETCRFLLTSGPNFVKLHTQREFYKKKKKLISRRISQQSVCRLYVVCQEAPFFLVGVENHYDNLA